MPYLRKTSVNLLGNLFGKAWIAIFSLAFVPLFMSLLGSEAYGLIGVYISIFTIVNVLDFGISTALNRSLAITNLESPASIKFSFDTLKTFESIYLLIGIVVGVGIYVSAPLFANHWLEADEFSPAQVTEVVQLMAIVIFFQWPSTLYASGLLGAGRQLEMNLIKGVHATLQWGGTLAVLYLAESNIQTYFYCQMVINIVSSIWMRRCLWQTLQSNCQGYRPRFSKQALKESKGFIAGLGFYSIVFVFISQSDRFFVSKLLPLDSLGYYMISLHIASTMMYIGVPLYHTIFPKISKMVSDKDPALPKFYKTCTQLLGAMTIPACIAVSYFSYELTFVWSQNVELATKTFQVSSIAIIGSTIFAFTFLPQALLLSEKRVLPLNVFNGIAFIVLPIAQYFLVTRYKLMGGIISMFGYFCCWHLALTPIAHRRLLQTWPISWLVYDISIPGLLSFVVFFIGKQTPLGTIESAWDLPKFGVLLLLSVTVFVLFCRQLRSEIWLRLRAMAP